MDVLDDDDRRTGGRELLDERDSRGVQTLARVERMNVGSNVEPEGEREDLATREPSLDLLERRALAQLVVLAQDLAERVVRDAGPVRQTSPRTVDGRRLLRRERLPELAHERRLPDARLTDERHQVRLGLRRRTSVRHAEKLELVVAADEHAAEPSDAARAHGAERAYDGRRDDTVRLPFRFDRSRCRELERSRDGRDGALAGEHLARLRSLLEPIGDVDDVSCHEGPSLVRDADDDVPGVHSDAEPELAVEETPHPLLHRECGMQRALGVVLERGRSAEHRHHGVACELLDGPARPLDLLAHCVVERLEARPHALRIAIAGVLGRADQVGEENGDELALLACAHGGSVAERSRSR